MRAYERRISKLERRYARKHQHLSKELVVCRSGESVEEAAKRIGVNNDLVQLIVIGIRPGDIQ